MEVIDFIYVSLGSSTGQLHDSLGSRRACAYSKDGFGSKNGDHAWGVSYRRAAFCCAFAVELYAKDTRKEMFPFCGGVCCVKRFTTGSRNSLKDVRKSQMMSDQVRKWLRQQSKDFYVAGFEALVKRWDKCISVGGGYAEEYVFPQDRISHVLRFISICDLFTDSPSYKRKSVYNWISRSTRYCCKATKSWNMLSVLLIIYFNLK
jgi:hypothetical protein